MIKLIDLLLEKKGDAYEYGCVMLDFKFGALKEIQDQIKKEDIYTEEGDRTYGLENEPHVTLLYGLHKGIPTSKIKNVLDKFKYGWCKAYNGSIFENDKYDVLKFDIRGKSLKGINKELTKFPHTNDYDSYHPHLTIGYLKPGKGKEYVKMLEGAEYDLYPKYATYSHDNVKDKINIAI